MLLDDSFTVGTIGHTFEFFSVLLPLATENILELLSESNLWLTVGIDFVVVDVVVAEDGSVQVSGLHKSLFSDGLAGSSRVEA